MYDVISYAYFTHFSNFNISETNNVFPRCSNLYLPGRQRREYGNEVVELMQIFATSIFHVILWKFKGCFPFNQLVQFEIQGITCVEWNSIFQLAGTTCTGSSHYTSFAKKYKTQRKQMAVSTFFTFLTCFGGQSTAIIF